MYLPSIAKTNKKTITIILIEKTKMLKTIHYIIYNIFIYIWARVSLIPQGTLEGISGTKLIDLTLWNA